MGWIGIFSEATAYLDAVGADKDDEEKFLIYGQLPVFFLGIATMDSEVVIPDGCQYSKKGVRLGLAEGLCSTSYGHRTNVIGEGHEKEPQATQDSEVVA